MRSPARFLRMIVAIADTAQAVISRIGWRTVVSSGQMVLAIAVSSKPQTVMSLGTSRWRRCATATVAAAISSFDAKIAVGRGFTRSEEHTSELQSLMRISYAVFC